jgi:16S rRNA G966 N2-methylase RsmD
MLRYCLILNWIYNQSVVNMINKIVFMRNRSLLSRINYSLHHQGMTGPFIRVINLITDYWFDFRFNLNTCSMAELKKLTIDSTNLENGFMYMPAKVIPLRRAFNYIQPMLAPDSVLVDFGSGKGRVLLIAMESGFKEVHGIEFAHELCVIAKKNLAIYKDKNRLSAVYKVVETDATKYVITPDENVFFMFNPFNEIVLNKVLDNILISEQVSPRKILIIYGNPKYGNVIEQRNEFKKLKTETFLHHTFSFYTIAD